MPSPFDNSSYIIKHQVHKGTVWVHVNEGVVTGSNNTILRQLKLDVNDCLEIKWQQGVETIVGVEVHKHKGVDNLLQTKLIDKILKDPWDKMCIAQTPLPLGYHATTDNILDGDPQKSGYYLSLVGSLSYLAVGTRPNIAFAVNYMGKI